MVRIEKWEVILVAVVCSVGVLFASLNLLTAQQAESLGEGLSNLQVNLGLDLQGGSHLLLEVEVEAVVVERLEALVDSVRTVLRKARIRYTGLGVQGHSVRVTVLDTDRASDALGLVRELDPGTVVELGDGSVVSITLTEEAMRERRQSAVAQSIEIVRRRIDASGVREPTIQRQGEDRILVQLPGIDDPERMKRLLGKTAKMTFQLVDDRVTVRDAMAGRVPPGSQLMPSADEVGADGQPRMYLVQKRVMVSGESLIDAKPTYSQGQPVVSFRFDSVGAKRFGRATTDNVKKLFAIILDGRVISAPQIREPILGGSGIITGSFSIQEADDLALLLRAGALPAPLIILEERTVGPGLGADSIAAGKIASIIGMILVVVFMVVAYGRFGVMADVALVFNLILILAVLSMVQATLTLPGIAGIVLTVGMAVDANVLIFERIREEVRAGRTPINAIDTGYKRARTTIFDANITTLIAALMLLIFGSGPVRGFAVTLSIGIATSLFTAIMVTRLIVVWWLRRTKPKTLDI